MADRSLHEGGILDRPLWCVQLRGRGLCAAETAEGSFLVLFSSPALAGEFISDASVEASERPSPHLYSRTRAQFVARARSAVADGFRGILVDLRLDGQVQEIIPFQELAIGSPAQAGWLRPEGTTLH